MLQLYGTEFVELAVTHQQRRRSAVGGLLHAQGGTQATRQVGVVAQAVEGRVQHLGVAAGPGHHKRPPGPVSTAWFVARDALQARLVQAQPALVDQRSTGVAVQVQAGAFEHQATVAGDHQWVAEQVAVLVALEDALVLEGVMQLRKGDAATANQYGVRVVRLIAGNGTEQAVVDERLERPATALGREHWLQADTAACGGARAFRRLHLHGLTGLGLQLLQVCLVRCRGNGAE